MVDNKPLKVHKCPHIQHIISLDLFSKEYIQYDILLTNGQVLSGSFKVEMSNTFFFCLFLQTFLQGHIDFVSISSLDVQVCRARVSGPAASPQSALECNPA